MELILKYKKIFRVAAGVVFAFLTIGQIETAKYYFELIAEYGFDFSLFFAIITTIAFPLIAVGLFINRPIVSIVGAGIGALYNIIRLISELDLIITYDWGIDVDTVLLLLTAISYILVLLCCAHREKAYYFGIAAGIVYFVSEVIEAIDWEALWGFNPLFAIGAVLLGFAFATEKKPALAKTSNVAATAATESTIEKLTKLKSLLDSGIITQEEFDEKKKQMLGL